ncbi:hypothetical protein HPB47_001207 [Ixodes persulcatus]|uniref:Uncharacterized protein n=1 Tax=Ixodes persulcatus TaxID=34615 RepID=A0AC60PPP4_IXOPE|nr:hypothetical protein HPB47_001207 [Ixodes persulcatus]
MANGKVDIWLPRVPQGKTPGPSRARSPRRRTPSRRREAVPLPADVQAAAECWPLLDALEASPLGLPRALDVVLSEARPTAVVVDGVPTLALVQDVLLPEDILAQALREAGVPGLSALTGPTSGNSPDGSPRGIDAPPSVPDFSSNQSDVPGSSPSSGSWPSPDPDLVQDPLADEDDSLVDAALSILRWLQRNQPVPPDHDDDADSVSDDDSRRPAAFPLQSPPPIPPPPPSSPTVPFDFVPVLRDVFADDSSSGLGICFAIGNVVILTDTPATIYRRELWAVLFALLLEPPQTRVLTDNRAVYHALTKGRKGKGL